LAAKTWEGLPRARGWRLARGLICCQRVTAQTTVTAKAPAKVRIRARPTTTLPRLVKLAVRLFRLLRAW